MKCPDKIRCAVYIFFSEDSDVTQSEPEVKLPHCGRHLKIDMIS